MAKTLCDWSKSDIEKDSARLAEIVSHPLWYCRKCARAACDKKHLCKPRVLATKTHVAAKTEPAHG